MQNHVMENMYKIFETKNYSNSLERIDLSIRKKLIIKISNYVFLQIKTEPHFGLNIKRLRNYSPDTWRYRIGRYRLFYELDEKDKIIFLTHIELRGNAYLCKNSLTPPKKRLDGYMVFKD